MNTEEKIWLPLVEYSRQRGVSTSTIRRHIKSKKLQYKLHNGKYYILYNAHDDSQPQLSAKTSTVSPSNQPISASLQTTLEVMQKALHALTHVSEKQIKEKDKLIETQQHQISLLEEEIDNLKTLVSVLESKTS